MNDKTANPVQTTSLILFFLLLTTPAAAGEAAPAWSPPDKWFIYLIILTALSGVLIAINSIRGALSRQEWSLADALSEGTEVTLLEKERPITDDNGSPVKVIRLYPSSSRLVALMGMIIILFMFLAFGAFALYGFASTGQMPDTIDKVVDFLMAGLTLFAPYLVNKFSKLFGGIISGR